MMSSRNEGFGRIAGALLPAAALIVCMVFTAAAQDEPEDKGWTGEFALAMSAQTGTVDTFAATVDSAIERTFTRDFLRFSFTGAYGTSRDRKNDPANVASKDRTVQDSQRLRSTWKRQIYDRWFWASGTLLGRDSTMDLEVRARVGTGPGYRFWRGEDPPMRHFDMAVGVGYRYELYDGNTGPVPGSVPPDFTSGNGSDQQLADLIATFEYKNLLFDEKIEWSHTGGVAVPANKTSAYIITTEAIAGIPLTEAWSFRTGLFYEYVNEAPDDTNPSTFRVTLGLGYKF
jgi:Protein of unknown function, DUF481